MRFQYLVWADILSHLFDLGVAFLLALPIGWHEEKEARSAGIRTFPIVALASCGLVLVAIRVLGETAVYVASLHAVGRGVKTKSSTARLSGVLLIGLGLALLGEVPAIYGRTRADRLGYGRHGYCKCCK